MTRTERSLLAALKKVRPKDHGICTQVTLLTAHLSDYTNAAVDTLLSELFMAWPEFSGSRAFPVPYTGPLLERPVGYRGSHEGLAFFRAPLWAGEYGAARKRLLAWMIEQLEALK